MRAALEAALGDTGPARSLLVLAGLLAPLTDPATPHLAGAEALAAGPTRAIAGAHRRALADGQRWSHVLGELASLLGLGTAVTGTGTPAVPWRAEIAAAGDLRLALAAWNARDASTPAGEQRLRIGLLATTGAGFDPWSARAALELLAVDLPPEGPATVALVGEQRLDVALSPVPATPELAGVSIRAAAIAAGARWRPGAPLRAEASVRDVRVTLDGTEHGPLTLTFPPADPSGGDLGLGGAAAEVLELLRALARSALHSWGGDALAALADLAGITGDGPLLEPPDPADLGSLLARAGEALRAHLTALATGLDAHGLPNAWRALEQAAALIGDQLSPGDLTLPAVPVRGAGTYDDPWRLGLAAGGDAAADVLTWLEPSGPPLTWAAPLAARIAAAPDAATLLATVPWARAFASGLPDWLDADRHADGLEALAEWIAAGDGVSPLESQLPELPGWEPGVTLSSPHDEQPRDPAAIEQIAAQLGAWAEPGGERAVLLLGPAWSTAAAWADLLAAVEPGRPAGAHFDLRAGAGADAVTAVARHYTAELAPGPAGSLTAQIGVMLRRITALTGRAQVAIVAHSTAGVAARLAAEAMPAAVRGVVTLGTPHAGGPPQPLSDPALADAVRAARALAGTGLAGTPLGLALARLASDLDGPAAGLTAEAMPAAPVWLSAPVPGLALGSALGGDAIAQLAGALAARVAAAGSATPARPAPTHLGFAARAGLRLGDADEEEPPADGRAAALADVPPARLDASVRFDAGRVRLAAATTEPERPKTAATVRFEASRPGGWLAGDPVARGPGVRSAEIGARIVPAPGGSVSVEPHLVLRDVVLDAPRGDLRLGDTELARAVELLAGAGFDAAGLAALAASPVETLRARRDGILDALEAILDGPLAVAVPGLPLELSLDRATWALRLRTTPELPLAEGIGAALDLRLRLTDLQPSITASLTAGAVRLERTAAGEVTVAAEPWLAPLVVLPSPGPEALRSALAPVVPRVALSAALSAALGPQLANGAAIGALDRFLADPARWLAELGGGDIQALLQAAAAALGVNGSQGLELPGGILLSAAGSDPLRLGLAGTLSLPAGAGDLALALTLDVAADRSVSPGGTVTITSTLPGTWGAIAVRFGASAAGPSLVVTPQNGQPITLLPTFSGFGPLAAAATTTLLPHLLQAIVDALRPAPGVEPDGLATPVLALAASLDIYGADAHGFETPARQAKLAQMLQPGWLESQIADPAAVAGHIAALFGPAPLLPVPGGGDIDATGTVVTWTGPLPGGGTGAVAIDLGAQPAAHLRVNDLDTGPLVIVSAEVGFDATPTFAAAVRLDLDDDLAFMAPEAELGIDGGRFSLAVLPLGGARRDDVGIVLAPVPELTFTEDGAVALIVDWGLPLVAMLALAATEPVLDDALWTNGPSARDVLEGAGLIETGALPARLASPLPALEGMALGALDALATGLTQSIKELTIPVTDTLDVLVVADDGGRKGLRLKGREDVVAGDFSISLRFGEADWLDDPAGGVTLWLIRPDPGTIPLALDIALDATGIGAVLGSADGKPLIGDPEAGGPVSVGRIGGLLFFSLDFMDAARPARPHGGRDRRRHRGPGRADRGRLERRRLVHPEAAAGAAAGAVLAGHREARRPGRAGARRHRRPRRAARADLPARPRHRRHRSDRRAVPVGRQRRRDDRRDRGDLRRRRHRPGGGRGRARRAAGHVRRVRRRLRLQAARRVRPLDRQPVGAARRLPARRRGARPLRRRDRAGRRREVRARPRSGSSRPSARTARPASRCSCSSRSRSRCRSRSATASSSRARAGCSGSTAASTSTGCGSGCASGTADSILFPTDVVRRIDTIVRDLEEAFPIAEGQLPGRRRWR